jgi:hypothetical protein
MICMFSCFLYASFFVVNGGRGPGRTMLRLVGRSVRRARDGVILKSTTTNGGLL